jgi:hypothetical protein
MPAAELTTWAVYPTWSASVGLLSVAALATLQPADVNFWNYALLGTPLTKYPDTLQVCVDVLIALATVSLLYCVIHGVRSLTLRGATCVSVPGSPLNISLEFGSAVVISPIIFALYASSALELGGSLADRWTGTTRNAYTAIVLHTATDALGTVLFVALGKEPLLFLHHAATVSIFTSAALTGFGHYYCCVASTVELTNVFLFVITCGPGIGIDAGSLLHTCAGVLLWVFFTILRMGVLPYYALYFYVLDAYANPETTILAAPLVLKYLQWPAGVLVFLLSAFWYSKITKGLLKAIGIGGGAPKPKGE